MKKKSDDKIVKLNFSTDRHDAKVEASKQSEEQLRLRPQQRRIKKKAYDIYQRWVKKVKSKARTPQEVIQATYQLQTQLGELSNAAKECGLEEWMQFTLQIVEDKIASLVATGISAKNEIVMWIPENPTMLDADNAEIVRQQLQRDARPVQFRTLDELNAIPFVAAVRGKQGFVGLVLHGKGLVAVFNDGEAVPVGILANGVGVDKLPTLDAFSKALTEEQPKEKDSN